MQVKDQYPGLTISQIDGGRVLFFDVVSFVSATSLQQQSNDNFVTASKFKVIGAEAIASKIFGHAAVFKCINTKEDSKFDLEKFITMLHAASTSTQSNYYCTVKEMHLYL